ncbi:hypothetical protein HHK36_001380 [Tetracentron sinense]|uniref:Protein kinase domain-containing protein n=1 Tax=Tetracentron sinense TaxID=13715 RepID=A0A834ZSR9_TETSI|nr:hypothetical protein HHK36_001380 [Tetracentron sinense]
MKIAASAARGLEYLHKEKSLEIYMDFKASKILLDKDYNPKISELELAREGSKGEKTHIYTRVMGTMGYVAPEYSTTGYLTLKCDVYSFGVVLLELLTERKTIDNTLPRPKRVLVSWARSRLKDPKKETTMNDPLIKEHCLDKGFCQALAIVRNCCEEESDKRPNMEGVAEAISVIATKNYNPQEDQDNTESSRKRKRNKVVDRE